MRVLLILLCLLPMFSWAIEVKDAKNNIVKLSKPAQRIVSLAPHVTELVYEAGAGDKLVGVSSFSDFPASASKLPVVSSHNSVNLEKILALRPDLLIIWESGTSKKITDKLERLGIPIFYSQPSSIQDIFQEIKSIANLSGTEKFANAQIEKYQQRLAKIVNNNQNKTIVTVYYQIWDRPYMTINRDHLINQVIDYCGGVNVFSNLDSLAPTVSLEAIITVNPQVFLRANHSLKKYRQSKDWLAEWQDKSTLEAVKRGNFYELPAQLISRHTPRILQGLEQTCSILDEVRNKYNPSN